MAIIKEDNGLISGGGGVDLSNPVYVTGQNLANNSSVNFDISSHGLPKFVAVFGRVTNASAIEIMLLLDVDSNTSDVKMMDGSGNSWSNADFTISADATKITVSTTSAGGYTWQIGAVAYY